MRARISRTCATLLVLAGCSPETGGTAAPAAASHCPPRPDLAQSLCVGGMCEWCSKHDCANFPEAVRNLRPQIANAGACFYTWIGTCGAGYVIQADQSDWEGYYAQYDANGKLYFVHHHTGFFTLCDGTANEQFFGSLGPPCDVSITETLCNPFAPPDLGAGPG